MKSYRYPVPTAIRYAALRGRRKHLLLAAVAPASNATAVLPPPIVHGMYEGNPPGLGRDKLVGDFLTVQVTVGPWNSPRLTDTIVLHWGDQWSQEYAVRDTTGTQLLSIAGSDIAGDALGDGEHYSGEGLQAVWYQVNTNEGTSSSTAVEIAIKTARPGGEDLHPETPINDNLLPPVAQPDPVEQGAAEVTFSVAPWRNIEKGDRLVLTLGGYHFDFPPVLDASATQTLSVPAEQLGGLDAGPSTPVTYQITDRVGNRSGFAPYLSLDIWLEPGDRLEQIEIFDAAKEPVAGAIDPGMTDGFARVPRYNGWKAGETVTVVLEGIDSNNLPKDTRLGPLSWKASDYYLDFAIPNAALVPLAGGRVRVHYETGSGGKAYRRLYVVNALPEKKLPPVTVVGERGGELPLDAINGEYVEIRIPDSEALVDFSRITLTMQGASDGGPVLEEEVHNVGGGEGHMAYTYRWPKARVAKLLQHQATFSYVIRRLDAETAAQGPRAVRPAGIRESEPHPLIIRQVGGPGQLAPPVIQDLVEGALPPTTPVLKVIVPGGTASVPGATVFTTVSGLTTVSHSDLIFDAGESLAVDFPGWPASNDGAPAVAWYVIGDQTSQETGFVVGDPSVNPPAPTIKEDGNGDDTLDLGSELLPGVKPHAVVPASAGLIADDLVTMYLTGHPAQGGDTKWESATRQIPKGDAGLSQEFAVPIDVVTSLLGGSATFHYTVKGLNYDGNAMPSLERTVLIRQGKR